VDSAEFLPSSTFCEIEGPQGDRGRPRGSEHPLGAAGSVYPTVLMQELAGKGLARRKGLARLRRPQITAAALAAAVETVGAASGRAAKSAATRVLVLAKAAHEANLVDQRAANSLAGIQGRVDAATEAATASAAANGGDASPAAAAKLAGAEAAMSAHRAALYALNAARREARACATAARLNERGVREDAQRDEWFADARTRAIFLCAEGVGGAGDAPRLQR
jgi:hypothetical protein